MRLRATRLSAIGGVSRRALGPVPILDQLGVSAAAAYSLRKVRSGAALAIRVRRSSDNAEANIGFAWNGDLDTAALLAHVGSGDGFVTTWYDQSGNARNATQATAANQPQIVSNGAIETQNGRPMPLFDGTDFLSFQGVHDAQWSLAVVGRATGNDQSFVQFGGINQFGSLFVNEGLYKARPTNSVVATAPHTDGEIAVLTATYGAAQINIWKNGAIGTPAAGSGVASNAGSVIGTLGGVYFLDGNIGEIIALNGVLSTTDRQTLERNEGAYYSITVD